MTTSGYSGTPLARKLGIKEGYHCYFHKSPAHYFDLFEDLPDIELVETPEKESLDFIHAFVLSDQELKEIGPKVKNYLKKTGILWMSWPKQSSGIKTDINRDVIRTYLLGIGLVDIKVAAVDETWSGLKFMYRVKDR